MADRLSLVLCFIAICASFQASYAKQNDNLPYTYEQYTKDINQMAKDFIAVQARNADDVDLGPTIPHVNVPTNTDFVGDNDDDEVTDDAVPGFTWDDNDYPDGEIRLIVSFPDGGEDDVASLKPYDPIPNALGDIDQDEVDACIYRGELMNESDVPVALNGCKGDMTYSVTFASERLSDHLFHVIDGVVRAVRPNKNSTYSSPNDYVEPYQATRSVADEFDGNLPISPNKYKRQASTLPARMEATILLHYDDQFRSAFGSQTLNKMRRIFNMAQNIIFWSSFGTRLQITVKNEYHLQASITAPNDLNLLRDFTTNSHPATADMFLYLSMLSSGNTVGGVAYASAVCSNRKGDRIGIVEYHGSELITAEVIAHELGHIIGMYHDFHVSSTGSRITNPPKTVVENGQRVSCTNNNGIMDYYQASYNKWSACSRTDLLNYYNRIYDSYGGFCLAAGCQSSGSYCYLLNRGYTCSSIAWYFYEYCQSQCGVC